MVKELIEIMTLLFNRDNTCIDIIEKEFNNIDYARPPEDVTKYVKESLNDESIEFISAYEHQVHVENSDGLKIPKGSFDMWFKFKDIKVKRRKIFRFGDYYLRVVSTGFDKYMFRFYTKHRKLVKRDYKYVDNFNLAQHPHISTGTPCFAGMEKEIMCSISNYNLGGFLWNIKNFLQSWNYRSPHHNPERFEFLRVNVPQSINGVEYSPDKFDDYIQTNESRTCNVNSEYNAFSRHLDGMVLNTISLKLTSARCKLYETEPLSRLMYEIPSLNDNQRREVFSNNIYSMSKPQNFVYNFSNYLRAHLVQPEGYQENDWVYLVHYIWDQLMAKVKITTKLKNGDWTTDNARLLRTMRTFRDVELKYYMNVKNDEFVDYKLFYLGHTMATEDKNNTEELHKLIRTLGVIKDACEDNYTSTSTLKLATMAELSKLIRLDVFQNDLEHCLSELWLHEPEQVSNTSNTDKIKDINNSFRLLKVKLTKAMNKTIVDYHQTEIRRLTNGTENNVQIENLNL